MCFVVFTCTDLFPAFFCVPCADANISLNLYFTIFCGLFQEQTQSQRFAFVTLHNSSLLIKERKKEASISMLPFSYLCLMVSMSQIHAPAVYGNTPAICHITARHPRRTPPSLTEQYHKSYAHHLFVSK